MTFFGAKSGSGVYQAIINLMPPHDTYIEPFFGTGAIMGLKIPAAINIAIDLDIKPGQPTIDSLKKRWPESRFDVLQADALQYLNRAAFTSFNRQTLVYCDPPYLHSTRTSSARYRHEFTDRDHHSLLGVLKSLDCLVMLSGYRNEVYQATIPDWFNIDFQTMTRGGARTETVWCNFEPSTVHYHAFAGKDFTDRQRIKRKAARWARRYEQLPPGERQAVLAAILSRPGSYRSF